jgi:hypothetical protein
LRYKKYKEGLEARRIEERNQQIQIEEDASGAKIKKFREQQGLNGSR